MTDSPTSKAYVIDSANEAERLEAQARLAGIEGHLARLSLPESGVVLDVGCGSGSMARLIARAHPGLEVVGIDSNAVEIIALRRKEAHQDEIGITLGLETSIGLFQPCR